MFEGIAAFWYELHYQEKIAPNLNDEKKREGHSADPDSLMYYAPDLDDPAVQALRLLPNELADLEDLRRGVL